MSFGPLIDGATLEAMLEAEDLLILDATFFLPTEGRDARAEFAARRLPRAAFYDIDAIADPAAEAPHMIPDHISTLAALAALGATPDRRIVLYDRARMMGAARAWWTLRLSGFDAVAVLDGGLDLWAAENRPLASGPLAPPRPAEAARASRREALIATAADVAAQGAAQLVDARAAEAARAQAAQLAAMDAAAAFAEARSRQAQGDFAGALSRFLAARAGFERQGDRLGAANSLQGEGESLAGLGDVEAAAEAHRAAADQYRSIGAPVGEANAAYGLARVLSASDPASAAERFREAARLYAEAQLPEWAARARRGWAALPQDARLAAPIE